MYNKPDVIFTWGKHMDYPYARYMLEKFSEYFNNVLIGLTDHGVDRDYTKFLTNEVKAKFKSIPRSQADQDWRSEAVNTMLEESTADRILFLEQDFLIRDRRFFETLLTNFEHQVFYYNEDGREHPACALLPRSIIEQTSKDFSARPPLYDHFGLFFREALSLSHGVDLEQLTLYPNEDFKHLAGLTQNYHATPYFKPHEFLTYNHYAQRLPIVYNEFRDIMRAIDEKEVFEESEANEEVLKFFPKESRGEK